MEKNLFRDTDRLFVSYFKSMVKEADSVKIIGHKGPDDDCISSMLSTYTYITKYLEVSVNVRMLITGERNDRWDYFKGYEEVEYVRDVYDEVGEKDLLIFLDGPSWTRFSNREESEEFKGNTICIDHHPSNGNKFQLSLVAPQYSSTAEIVYRLFYTKEELDRDICEKLLLGILGDTGNFSFINKEKASVFSVAERLVKEGDIDIQSFQASYSKLKKESFELLKELMKKSKVENVDGWPKYMYTYISEKYLEDYSKTTIKSAKASFMHYIRHMEGVSWGFIIGPDEEGSNVSFRSLPGSVNVRVLAEKSGIGGGHDRASGGFISDTPRNAARKINSWVKKNEAPLD